MGRIEGKVAFITGAARGQGRSHAIRLAEEGADIIAVDIASQVDSVPYPMSTPEDLAETVKQVEALDRRIVATQADVRDYQTLKQALDNGVAELGRLDIVCANAGIGPEAVRAAAPVPCSIRCVLATSRLAHSGREVRPGFGMITICHRCDDHSNPPRDHARGSRFRSPGASV
jgi:NAD(P)-dependent dehydrogenase (short-subunit alcohol dehydrogenase family)